MVTVDQYVAATIHVSEVAARLGYTGRVWAGGLANLSQDSFDCTARLSPSSR